MLSSKLNQKVSGLYIHFPFCHSKCTYCSFVTKSYDEELSVKYIKALEKEINNFPFSEVKISDFPIKINSLYLGGGTPSILSPKSLSQIVNLCRDRFEISTDAEITMEVNPNDAQLERLLLFKEIGINRISLGIQSFFDKHLKAVGRDHSAQEAVEAFQNLRKIGFNNISIDLIIGLPDQTFEEWQYNLATALKLEPEHLSLYLLEVKEKTNLALQIDRGDVKNPDDDLAADMYKYTLDELEKVGFEIYEISNFARSSNLKSRHNLKYWNQVPVYGFGVGAHSYDGEERYENSSNISDYINRIERDGTAVTERTNRTSFEKFQDALIMRLRLSEGILIDEFENSYGINIQEFYEEELDRLIAANTLELLDGRLKLTHHGILLSNEVFVSFM